MFTTTNTRKSFLHALQKMNLHFQESLYLTYRSREILCKVLMFYRRTVQHLLIEYSVGYQEGNWEDLKIEL